ncbi:hypothetical protein A6769_32415 [Nostoc punctiforme NIES-2108]|uniref:Uncharacterized protein n=1 Tax=Nostoc punctiforme NIES-2108 TaxID=1356359 RepID=A0A367R5R9_NOSPU|nr:hypothetical protein A6769_32415 [Nostoc punctiforme NIES-2108]
MSANKPDKNNTDIITNCDNEPIVSAFDVEYDTVVSNNTGITMSGFNINWTLPIGVRGLHSTKFLVLLQHLDEIPRNFAGRCGIKYA